MISVSINGERQQLSAGQSIAAALASLGYEAAKVAVAINGEFVPRSDYAAREIRANDELDIVAPVQGG